MARLPSNVGSLGLFLLLACNSGPVTSDRADAAAPDSAAALSRPDAAAPPMPMPMPTPAPKPGSRR